MAKEKLSSAGLAVTLSGQRFVINKSKSEDITGTQAISNIQTVGTSWEAILLGDLASADLLQVVNNDATNYVQLAADNAGATLFSKLTPGRFAFFPPDPSVTIYAKADTAACQCAVVAVEP